MQVLFVVAVLAFASVNADEDIQPGDRAQYQFEYGVASPQTGDIKAQRELRAGHNVLGEYALREADGTTRLVSYRSSPGVGLEAVVRRAGVALHPPQELVGGAQQFGGIQVGGQAFAGQQLGGQAFGGIGGQGLGLGVQGFGLGGQGIIGQGIGGQGFGQQLGGQILGGQGLGLGAQAGLGLGGQAGLGLGGQAGLGLGGQGGLGLGAQGFGGLGLGGSFVGATGWTNQGIGKYH